MALQILYNLGIALLWLALDPYNSVEMFLLGYLVGTIILYLFYKDKNRFYLNLIWKAIRVILYFLREVCIQNLNVLPYLFVRKNSINPGIISMDVDFNTHFELVMFSNFVTMTPGSIVVSISNDNKKVYIHVLDTTREESIVNKLRKIYENPIREVSGKYD